MNQVSYLKESSKMQIASEGKTPKTKRGIKTKAKLLEAAEIEFGSRGFMVMIADIKGDAEALRWELFISIMKARKKSSASWFHTWDV